MRAYRTNVANLGFALVVSSSAIAAADKTEAAKKPGTITGTVKVTETDGKPVGNLDVIVYLVGPTDASGPKQTSIEQKNRTFVPDLVAVTVGDTVVFPNRDSNLHNVFSPKPKFDLGTLKKGEGTDKPQKFDKQGVVDVYCNIHPEMAATILVLPNRHYTRTANGTFELTDVPPGSWKLFAYTKRATKPASVDITVVEDGKATANLAIVRGAEAPHPDKFGGKYSGSKGYP